MATPSNPAAQRAKTLKAIGAYGKSAQAANVSLPSALKGYLSSGKQTATEQLANAGGGVFKFLNILNRVSQTELQGLQNVTGNNTTGRSLGDAFRDTPGKGDLNLRSALGKDPQQGGRLAGFFDTVGTAVIDPTTYLGGTGVAAKTGRIVAKDVLEKSAAKRLSEKGLSALTEKEKTQLAAGLAAHGGENSEKFVQQTMKALERPQGITFAGSPTLIPTAKATTAASEAFNATRVGKAISTKAGKFSNAVSPSGAINKAGTLAREGAARVRRQSSFEGNALRSEIAASFAKAIGKGTSGLSLEDNQIVTQALHDGNATEVADKLEAAGRTSAAKVLRNINENVRPALTAKQVEAGIVRPEHLQNNATYDTRQLTKEAQQLFRDNPALSKKVFGGDYTTPSLTKTKGVSFRTFMPEATIKEANDAFEAEHGFRPFEEDVVKRWMAKTEQVARDLERSHIVNGLSKLKTGGQGQGGKALLKDGFDDSDAPEAKKAVTLARKTLERDTRKWKRRNSIVGAQIESTQNQIKELEAVRARLIKEGYSAAFKRQSEDVADAVVEGVVAERNRAAQATRDSLQNARQKLTVLKTKQREELRAIDKEIAALSTRSNRLGTESVDALFKRRNAEFRKKGRTTGRLASSELTGKANALRKESRSDTSRLTTLREQRKRLVEKHETARLKAEAAVTAARAATVSKSAARGAGKSKELTGKAKLAEQQARKVAQRLNTLQETRSRLQSRKQNLELDKPGPDNVRWHKEQVAAIEQARKDYEKKLISDGYVKISTGTLGEKWALEPVAQHLEELSDAMTPERVGQFGRMMQQWTTLWKGYATVPVLFGAGFHTRNAAGNVWNMFVHGFNNPAYFGHATQAVTEVHKGVRNGKTFEKALDEANIPQERKVAIRAALKEGILDSAYFHSDFARHAPESSAVKRAQTLLNPFSTDNASIKSGRAIGSFIEDTSRMAMFLSEFDKHGSAAQAARRTKEALFDYAHLSKTDREIKKLVPFWTFVSRNIPAQVRGSLEHPGRALFPAKAQGEQNASDDGSTEVLPQYALQAGQRPIGGGLLGNIQLPQQAALQAVSPLTTLAQYGNKNSRPDTGLQAPITGLLQNFGGGPLGLLRAGNDIASGASSFSGAPIDTDSKRIKAILGSLNPQFTKEEGLRKKLADPNKRLSAILSAAGVSNTKIDPTTEQAELQRRAEVLRKYNQTHGVKSQGGSSSGKKKKNPAKLKGTQFPKP